MVGRPGKPTVRVVCQGWNGQQPLCGERPCVELELLRDVQATFSHFPLFMCVQGETQMHTNPNDFVSVLFPINLPQNCGGGLELPALQKVVNWKIGDACVINSADITHGSRNYCGEIGDRLICLFILQKSYLKLLNKI